MARVFIGLSGFSYKPWQGPGRFYPAGLKQAEFLRHYSTRFETVEMDGIWYRMPTEKAVQSWIEMTPKSFIFSPKANRQITHLQRLKPDSLRHVQHMVSRLSPLSERKRLGPVLLQLPPNLARNDERLVAFLSALPKDLRWAMEFRHPSWADAGVEDILRGHDVAWAIAETDEAAPERRDTAGFWYLRLRKRDYPERALEAWADWLKQQAARGKDCFVYFKHEDEGSPWVFADKLLAMIGS